MADAPQASPDTRAVQTVYPTDLVDRLDAQCERLMIGRPLVLSRALALILSHLESMPDPLTGLSVRPLVTAAPGVTGFAPVLPNTVGSTGASGGARLRAAD